MGSLDYEKKPKILSKLGKKTVRVVLPLLFFSLLIIAFLFEATDRLDFDNRNVELTKKLEQIKSKENVSDFSKKVQEIVSKKGIKAWLIQDDTNPIISVSLVFDTGAVNDPIDKKGLSYMVSGLLDEGAADIKSKEFQETLKDKAIHLSFNAGENKFSASLDTLRENKDFAFDLLKKTLQKPRFDKEPVERIRRQILTSIRTRKENPSNVAGENLRKHIFANHDYKFNVYGNEKSIKSIKKEDLKNFVKNRLAKDILYIGVSGDISKNELALLLDKTFVDLSKKVSHKKLENPNPIYDGKTIKEKRNIPQTIGVFAQKGISRNDKDFYPLYVANYILGGGSFSSRLMQEVRVKKGYAYGVSSYLSMKKQAPMITGYVATNAKDFEKSKEIIKNQWKKMKKIGASKSELQDAKKYLIGSFPLRFSSLSDIAGMLSVMQYYDLGIDFLEKRNDKVRDISLKDIRRVSKKYLTPEKMVFSVIGK